MEFDNQQEWKKFEKEVGEDAAKNEIIRQLQLLIDYLKSPGYPKVFAAEIAEPGEDIFKGTFMTKISVTLAYPWPG